MAGQRRLETFPGNARGEMKGSAPSEFEEVRDQVIVEIVDFLAVGLSGFRSSALGQPEALFVWRMEGSALAFFLLPLHVLEILNAMQLGSVMLIATD